MTHFQNTTTHLQFDLHTPDKTVTVDDSTHTAATEESEASFVASLLEEEGLMIMPAKSIPIDYKVERMGMLFPSNWVPTKIYKKGDAIAVKMQLLDEMFEFGVASRPKMEKCFEEVSTEELGGRARLLPGNSSTKRFYSHQFAMILCLWGDVCEGDEAKGIRSARRLGYIVSAIMAEETELAQRIVEEADDFDKHFIQWWKAHIDSVLAKSKSRKSTKRYLKQLRELFRAFGEEPAFLRGLESPTTESLEGLWSNRIETMGGFCAFELQLMAINFCPSKKLYSELHELRFLFAKILRMINEVASIPKDVLDESGSLFTAELSFRRLSIMDTINIFIDASNEAVYEFEQLAITLLSKWSDTTPKLAKFLDNIRFFLFGLAEWHVATAEDGQLAKRYSKVTIVHPEKKVMKRFCVQAYSRMVRAGDKCFFVLI